MIFDCFPFHDEMDMLECRLYELESVPNVVHVLVEADVTHQDRPKPWYFEEHRDRFKPWMDRIVYVKATGLPTMAQDPDPWARELAQRTFMFDGLAAAGATSADIVMQSDLDEIPHPLVVRNLRVQPGGVVALHQRGHFWAVDWLYGPGWNGTVVCNASDIARREDFPRLRSLRNLVRRVGEVPGGWASGGWHLSWLGGRERVTKKLHSFCHPEVFDRIQHNIEDDDFFWRHGWHVDGVRMLPVEVDKSWPRWVYERRCPESWWRPR